jgi:hypothetical protein
MILLNGKINIIDINELKYDSKLKIRIRVKLNRKKYLGYVQDVEN